MTQINVMKRVVTHPGLFVLERILQPHQISLTKFAEYLKVSPKHLSEITRGLKPIRPNLAYRIELATGYSAEMFLELQMKHDLSIEREHVFGISRIPPFCDRLEK